MAKTNQPLPDENRPIQMGDLTSQGKKVMDSNMRDWGRAKSNVPEMRESITTSIAAAGATAADTSLSAGKRESAAKSAIKQGRNLNALDRVAPVLKDKTVTRQSAGRARASLTNDSARRAEREAPTGLGGGSQLRAMGAGWYFDHRSDLDEIANTNNIESDRIVTASAVMSPSNSPSNEKAAVASLALLHSQNPMVHIGEGARKHIGTSGSVRFSDLTPDQASKLASANIRQHVSVEGVDTSDWHGLSKAGTNRNAAKAIGVLRGDIADHEAIDPHTSPKVWSYRDSISKARPGGAVHEEYLSRAQSLLEMPGSERLDLFGLKHSTEGILSPTKTTAEDTWMMAVSSSQQLKALGTGPMKSHISPAKFVASDKSSMDRISKTADINGQRVSAYPNNAVTTEGLTHAWHNDATIRSAGQLSKQTGEIMPSVLAQETAWTESRRQAGKDDAYATHRKSHFDLGANGSPPPQIKGQTSLF